MKRGDVYRKRVLLLERDGRCCSPRDVCIRFRVGWEVVVVRGEEKKERGRESNVKHCQTREVSRSHRDRAKPRTRSIQGLVDNVCLVS